MKNRRNISLATLATMALGVPALAGPIYSDDFESPHADTAGLWSHGHTTSLGGTYSTILGRFSSESVTLSLNATEANTAGLGGDPGDPGDQGGRQWNLNSRPVARDRIPVPLPDGSGGGGGRPPGPSGGFDLSGPSLDLGGALGGSGNDAPRDPAFTEGTYALTFDLMLFDSWDANYEGYGPDTFRVDINGETVFDEFLEVHWLPNNFRMPDEIPEYNVFDTRWDDLIYRDITLEFEITEDTDRFDFAFIGSLNQNINDESWGIDNVRVSRVDPLLARSVPTPGAIALLGMGLGMGLRRQR